MKSLFKLRILAIVVLFALFINELFSQKSVNFSPERKVRIGKFPSSTINNTEYKPINRNYHPVGSNDEIYEIEEEEDDLVIKETMPKIRRKVNFEKARDLEVAESQKLSSSFKINSKSQWDVPFGGVDPMVAVGHEYLAVSDGGNLGFYNKKGLKLSAKAGGTLPSSARQLFAFFLDRTLANGSANPNHPSNWFNVPTNVPDACNPNHPGDADDGIINEAYDTRILYEKTYKRFIILSAIRNQCWSCKSCSEADKDICKSSSIRLYAWAVSITQDPRDGFYLYITGNNNVRDWPRVVVDQDYMVVAHNGKGRLGTPAISIFSWPDMTNGLSNIRRVDFLSDDISPRMYIPVQNKLSASSNLLFAHKKGENDLDFYQIKKPGIRSDIFKSGLLIRPNFIGGLSYDKNVFKGPLSGLTYDNKGIHFTTSQTDDGQTSSAAARNAARIWRIPLLSGSGGKLVVAPISEGSGFINYKIHSNYSYEYPALAVNNLNDVFVAFVRSSVKSDGTVPEVRYTAWVHGKAEPINSVLVRQSESQPTYKCNSCSQAIPDNLSNKDDDSHHIDYAWAVADPADTGVFWLAHSYYNSNKEMRMHIAKANLVPLY